MMLSFDQQFNTVVNLFELAFLDKSVSCWYHWHGGARK